MNRNALLLVLSGFLVAVGLAYFLSGQSGETDGGSFEVASQEEAELERLLMHCDELIAEDLDASSVRAMVAEAGSPIEAQQAEAIVPLLRDHLTALRQNLEEAHAAKVAGQPINERRRYYIVAAQAHGKFQIAIRGIVSPEAALTIFQAYPAMLPPSPDAVRKPVKPSPPIQVSPEDLPVEPAK
jgi:hypothetical protein